MDVGNYSDKLRKRWEAFRKASPREAYEHLMLLAQVPRYRRYLLYAWIVFLTFILADTFSLVIEEFIPEEPVVTAPVKPVSTESEPQKALAKYKDIVNRDIFSSTGTIPLEGVSSGMAAKTRLPLNLIGTMIFDDPAKSIAAVADTTNGRIYPVQAGDPIGDKADVEKVEEFRVVFTNRQNGILEYVEMPHKEPEIPPMSQQLSPNILSGIKKGTEGISQVDETHYQIERSTIDKQMSNLNDVLQQARAIPNFENGNLNGYKIMQVLPGSVFEQLGIRNGDIVVGFNGNQITDPAKALAMLNDLKNQSQVSIAIKRNGTPMTMNYSLR